MKKFGLMAAVAACCSIVAPYAAANLVTNGSFEANTIVPTNGLDFQTFTPASSPAFIGWTIFTLDSNTGLPILNSGSVDLVGTYWQAADGTKSLDLDGNTQSGVMQSLLTTAGTKYTLDFSISGNPDSCHNCAVSTQMSVGVAINNQTYTFNITPSQDHNNMHWQTVLPITFTATSGSTDLSFASLTSGSYGMVLDNVSVVAVPESETWAMLLVGLGLVGLRLRKKERKEGRLLG